MLHPIYQTVKNLSVELPSTTTLIGFAGAPWTVATYMIKGRGSKDHVETKEFSNNHPIVFEKLINKITEATIEYLTAQIKAGAEVIKIFDSWAGALSGLDMIKFSYKPLLKITTHLKKKYPNVPVIVFPRGVGGGYTLFSESRLFNSIAIDQSVPPPWARLLQDKTVIQGNLDPIHLVTGGDKLKMEIAYLLDNLAEKPFVFNLGHGITPNAKIKNVELLLKYIGK